MEIDLVNDTYTPLTDEIFIKQGWERNKEPIDEQGEGGFYYWTLPLPKDNPDKNCPMLISTANDQWEEIGVRKGEYTAELFDFAGLGFCNCAEDVEDLYTVLTKQEILKDKKSDKS